MGLDSPCRMILLDAHPLIAYLGDDQPTSALVEPLLAGSAMTTVNAAEVIDHFVRLRHVNADEAVADIRQLGLAPIVVRSWLAEQAGLLRSKHYHRRTCAVSLADCIAAAGRPDRADDRRTRHRRPGAAQRGSR